MEVHTVNKTRAVFFRTVSPLPPYSHRALFEQTNKQTNEQHRPTIMPLVEPKVDMWALMPGFTDEA